MNYKNLKADLKKSINGSLFSHFQSGIFDFKGAEVAFEIWANIKIYEKDGEYYYKGYCNKEDSFLDKEVYKELKQKFFERYNNRMERLYWSTKFLRT